jgi:hypothetical protein
MTLAIMVIIFLAFLLSSIMKEEVKNSIVSTLVGLISSFYFNAKPSKQGDLVICKELKTFRKVIIPQKDRFLHTLILGPTGSGKTSQALLPFINQDLQNSQCGITVIDPKGDLAEKVYALSQMYGRKCLLFNPEYPNCPTFNPLYGNDEDTIIENMVLCFRMILHQSPDFFIDNVETLLRNSIKLVKRTCGNHATLLLLERCINNTGGIGHQLISLLQEKNKNEKDISKKHENYDIISYFINDYFNRKTETFKNCSSLRTQLSRLNSNKLLRRIFNPEDGHNDIDFSEHLESCNILAITTAQGILNQTLSRLLGYFIILNFQSAVFKRKGDENSRKPHFLYIDEFQEYANPSFGIMLTQGRSYRVASHLATQNRQLIAGNSSRDGQIFLDLVSANCRNIILFPDLPPDDCLYYSHMFGQKKVVRKTISRSKGAGSIGYTGFSDSQSEGIEPLIAPTEISQRKFGQITFKIVQNNTAQKAGHGKVNFLPSDINQKADIIVKQNRLLMLNSINPTQYRDTLGNLTKPIKQILSERRGQNNDK